MSRIIHIGPWCPDKPLKMDLGIIEAIMLWPDDEGAQSEFIRAGFIETTKGGLDEFGPEGLRWFCELLLDTPRRLDDLKGAAAERHQHGWIAGMILGNVLARRGLGEADATIGQEIATLGERLSREFRQRISAKTIHNVIWPRFRPVAHLWAAWIQNRCDGVNAFPCKGDDLGSFLAKAEAWRALGEATRTKQAAQPLLIAADMYCLPRYVKLPDARLTFVAAKE